MSYKAINIKDLNENLIKAIDKEWMLITAGTLEKHNMMTASWGFTGPMWGKPCAIAAIRPSRYTLEFVTNEDYYTLSFYGDQREIHNVCGKQSGRDIDKTAATGLTPVQDEDTGAVYFEEARMVFICRKLYDAPLLPEAFVDQTVLKTMYGGASDLHHMIYGEIVKALIKE